MEFDHNILSDPRRLDVLRVAALADSDAGAAFDRITRLAARVMSAPIALINFVDHSRLLFKSKYGLPHSWDNVSEIPLAGSLCRHILETRGPLILSDSRNYESDGTCDEFTNLQTAAYAGLPLTTSDGHLLGTFCVLDYKVRDWTDDEISALNDLAQATVSEIELRAARHLQALYARDLALQNDHNVTLLERQHRTEERLMRLGFDETARERAETARRQIESILEGITDGFFALDPSMRFTYINGRAEKLLHRSRGELIDTRLTDHPTPADLVDRLRAVQESKAPSAFEFNDELHGTFFEILAYPSPTGISVYFHDVTERKKTVDEIERRSNELQALSRRLVEVQETERGQIARELHDEVGQILTGLKLTLSAARRLPDAAKDAQLDQAQKLVNELIGHVRDLSLDLRPAMLDDLGLLPALLWHFERYTSQTGVEVTFRQADIQGRFNQAVETAAYRIVQEALTNVARYSQVKEATVSVYNMGDELHIEVHDSGVGFEPEKAVRAGASNGLTGMRERVNLLRGVFNMTSSPGAGATIRARIPFPQEDNCEPDAPVNG